ncbi:TPA: hypothetical protein KDY05_001998 [Vibrio parahaemolyticus]|nr:hypothetical protein [Vibrio parahaemolyticus]
MKKSSLFTLIIITSSSISGNVFAANGGKLTLPSSTQLKTVKGTPVGYFESEILRTSQQHIATGVHEFEVSLPIDAMYSIRANNKLIKPGKTAKMSKALDKGVLKFEVSPAVKKDIGKVEYQVYIPSLYSIDDRFWETYDPTYTAWVDTGKNSNFESWVPALAKQMKDFTQTRKYKDVFTRKRQDRDKDTNVGEIRNHGEPVIEYDYRDNMESRDVKASVGNYSNVGNLHDCGEWVPAASETYEGLTVDQTYTCKQDQTRTWTYKVNSNVIGSHPQNRTIDDVDNRTVPGTKNPWLSTASSFGEWKNSGGGYSYSSWDPAIVAQTVNFTQSRTYKQNQTRTEQKRQKNAVTGALRNVGAVQQNTKVVTVSQTRTVNVSVSGWVNSGGVYSCSGWSPSPATVASGSKFTQKRSCSQAQVKTWTYKVGSNVITTRPQNRVVKVNQTRTATGTKSVYGSWVLTKKAKGSTIVFDPNAYYKDITGLNPNTQNNPDECNVKNGITYCQYKKGQKCRIGGKGIDVRWNGQWEAWIDEYICK